MKKLVDSYNTINQKVKYIQKKADEIKEKIGKPRAYEGYVEIQGTVYPGTEINLYGNGERITSKMTHKTFRLDEDGMVTHE